MIEPSPVEDRSSFAGLVMLCTAAATAQAVSYRLLATKKTSTMQKEMNEAADAGYRFGGVMGGDTAFGGSEVVDNHGPHARGRAAHIEYRLLATSKTSTMQKEMQEAGDAGFEYRGQTVFSSAFGGEEVVVILERDRTAPPQLFEYRSARDVEDQHDAERAAAGRRRRASNSSA